MAAPLLIALPSGLQLGGVTTFAARLASALAARGRAVTVVRHPEPVGSAAPEVRWHESVECINAPDGFDTPGDLSRHIPLYRGLVRRLAAESGGPVIVAPQGLGDAYGVAAALCQTDPELLRVVGWQHSDIEYDTRVLERYAPVIACFVGVSAVIATTLRARLGPRALDVHEVPYGVEVPEACPRRLARADEPLRLIYTGRLEHRQKRILALAHLATELDRRGVAYTLTVVGDGPAAAAFDAACKGLPRIRRLSAQPPSAIARLLAEHDALVLPSRYEGLSVSMLEALAAACVPILARTRSGAAQAVEPGYNGEIAEVSPDADEAETGRALADAVERFARRDRAAMAEAAWRTARERFSIERHADRIAAILDAAAQAPARAWPADLPCAFTARPGLAGTGAASGSVPADGAQRLRAALEALRGRRVIIHGAGQHTVQLGAVLAESAAEIVAIADDDRARHGSRLWGWPVVDPAAAGRLGATDVVISSWMHEAAIWSRRGVYEAQGMRIHRLYAPPGG